MASPENANFEETKQWALSKIGMTISYEYRPKKSKDDDPWQRATGILKQGDQPDRFVVEVTHTMRTGAMQIEYFVFPSAAYQYRNLQALDEKTGSVSHHEPSVAPTRTGSDEIKEKQQQSLNNQGNILAQGNAALSNQGQMIQNQGQILALGNQSVMNQGAIMNAQSQQLQNQDQILSILNQLAVSVQHRGHSPVPTDPVIHSSLAAMVQQMAAAQQQQQQTTDNLAKILATMAAQQQSQQQQSQQQFASFQQQTLMALSQLQASGTTPQLHTPHRGQMAPSTSSTSSDDEALATDVDDEDACRKARENWVSRTRSTPKGKAHLVSWLADTVSEADFVSRWGRKLAVDGANARDTADALHIESALGHLHRALAADKTSKRNVAVYAVQSAMDILMCMGQKMQMRHEGATADALQAFDVEVPAVARKCRRRATDFLHLEAIAANACRKHQRKKNPNPRRPNNRPDRGGNRGGDAATDVSAPGSRSTSVAPQPKRG